MINKNCGTTALANGTAIITFNYSAKPAILQEENHPMQLCFPQAQFWFKEGAL